MGLSKGSMSLTRYRVLGLKPNLKLAQLNENLGRNQARRIRLNGISKEQSSAWALPERIVDDADARIDQWDLSDCRFAEGLLLELRIETRKVPSRLLQAIVKERVGKKESKRAKPLNSKEKRQIWIETKDELTGLALPDIQSTESYWDLDTHEVLLFSTSKKVQKLFEELFFKTFCDHLSGSLLRVEPPLLGLRDQEWISEETSKELLEKIVLATPASFGEEAQRTR